MKLTELMIGDWVQDFYKKCGYIPIKEEGGFMRMYKLLYEEKSKYGK